MIKTRELVGIILMIIGAIVLLYLIYMNGPDLVLFFQGNLNTHGNSELVFAVMIEFAIPIIIIIIGGVLLFLES